MKKELIIFIWLLIVTGSCTSSIENCVDWYASQGEEIYDDLNWISLFEFNHIEDIYDFNNTSENWKKNITYIEVDGRKVPIESRRVRHRHGIVDYFGYEIVLEEGKEVNIDSLVIAIKSGQDLLDKMALEDVYFILGVKGKINREEVLKRVRGMLTAMCISFGNEKIEKKKMWPIVISDQSRLPPIPPPPEILEYI